VPHTSDGLRVLISFGHVQMMMDAMRPLAISVLGSFLNFAKTSVGSDVLVEAGGRLFIDPTPLLALKPAQHLAPKVLGVMFDEGMAASLKEVFGRDDFKRHHGKRVEAGAIIKLAITAAPGIGKVAYVMLFANPVRERGYFISATEKSWSDLEKQMAGVSGPDRVRLIQDNLNNIFPSVLRIAFPYLITAILSSRIVLGMLKKLYGEAQGAIVFSRLNRSLPGNVTAESGLAVGDLADTARKYPEVVEYLQEANDETFYHGLLKVHGGPEFKRDLDRFMDKYGVRSPGEIDITNPRWRDSPTLLVAPILSHIRSVGPGEHREKFKQGAADADLAAREAVSDARKARLGFFKAKALSRLIKVYRNLMGMREYPKYVLMQHFYVYRQGILAEARALAEKGVLQQEQDVFFLTLDELLALEDGRFSGDVQELIASRKKSLEQYRKLTPPRVMTSEGEVITGKRPGVKAPEGNYTNLQQKNKRLPECIRQPENPCAIPPS
jgi:pyruvate,water dikinase